MWITCVCLAACFRACFPCDRLVFLHAWLCINLYARFHACIACHCLHILCMCERAWIFMHVFVHALHVAVFTFYTCVSPVRMFLCVWVLVYVCVYILPYFFMFLHVRKLCDFVSVPPLPEKKFCQFPFAFVVSICKQFLHSVYVAIIVSMQSVIPSQKSQDFKTQAKHTKSAVCYDTNGGSFPWCNITMFLFRVWERWVHVSC